MLRSYGRENVKTTTVPIQTFEQFVADRGLTGDADVQGHIHAGLRSAPTTKTYARWNAKKLRELQDARTDARRLYRAAIERGEIRAPTFWENLQATAEGHSDNESVQAARRVLAKRGAHGGVPMTAPATALLQRVGTGGAAPLAGRITIEGDEYQAHVVFPERAPVLTLTRDQRIASTVLAEGGAAIEIEGRPFVAELRREGAAGRLTVRRHPHLWCAELDEPLSPMHPMLSG